MIWTFQSHVYCQQMSYQYHSSVADNIFALQKHVMKPYSRKNCLTYNQKIFNYRITRARINIECAFGLLQNKWGVLQRNYAFKLKTYENIIMALLCLHNMIITTQLENNIHQNDLEEVNIDGNDPDKDMEDNEIEVHVHSERQRSILAQYFVSNEGSVPWQDKYI